MSRAPLPIPLVNITTVGNARDFARSLPLKKLWETFLPNAEARVSPSRMHSLRRTCALTELLPPFPEEAHFAKWCERLSETRADSTVRLHLDDVRSLFNWSHANNFTVYNPVRGMKWKKREARRHAIRDIYSAWPTMLAVAGDDVRTRGLLAVLRFAGLRPSEAFGLQPGDVETWREPWVLHVRRQRSANGLECSPKLKNGHSYRPVEVRPELRELLTPVLALGPAKAWTGRGGQAEVQTPLLFAHRVTDVSRLIAALRGVLPSEFPEAVPGEHGGDGLYVLRHSVAVEMYRWDKARAGVADVLKISRVLGHESVKYTETYLRGLMGADVTAGAFAGMTGAPPWAGGATSKVAVEVQPEVKLATQTTMPLGVLGAVKKGGAPPSNAVAVERAAAGVSSTGRRRRRGSNPSEAVSHTEQPQRRTKGRL